MPEITLEAPETRLEEGAIQVHVQNPPLQLPAAPDVHVNVELAEVTVNQPPITVNVPKQGNRKVEFSDGRTATIEEE